MARQVKAHESTGQMGINSEPLNLEPLNGYHYISPALTISVVLAAGSLLFIRAEPTRTA